jgi:hypothetical protein
MRKRINSAIALAAAALAAAIVPGISMAAGLSVRKGDAAPAVQGMNGRAGGTVPEPLGDARPLRFEFLPAVVAGEGLPNSTSGLRMGSGTLAFAALGSELGRVRSGSAAAPEAVISVAPAAARNLRFQFTKPVGGNPPLAPGAGDGSIWTAPGTNVPDALLMRIAAAPFPAAMPLVAIALVGIGIVGLRRQGGA